MKYESAALRQNKSSGKWRGLLKYKDPSGKWKQVTKTLEAKGKRAAQAELDSWRADMEEAAEREAGTSTKLTVADYVERYISSKAGTVEASTLSGYRGLLVNCIAPELGGVLLSDLNAERVEDWKIALMKRRSRITAQKALVLLRSALTVAHRRGVIPANPTDTVEKPKSRKQRPNSLTERERTRVVEYVNIAPEDDLSVAILLALFCGMRRGEVCALRWRNVDVAHETLRVAEALGVACHGTIEESDTDDADKVFADVYVKEPKNSGSARVVNYSRMVTDALKARRAHMREECMKAGVAFRDSMFVCGGVDGSPMHPHTLWRRWNALVTGMGLSGTEGRPPTFHDLRHTYATTAIASGVDVKTVSSQMGHANAAMTLNTYASADPDAAKRAAVRMDEVLTAQTSPAGHSTKVVQLNPTGTEG